MTCPDCEFEHCICLDEDDTENDLEMARLLMQVEKVLDEIQDQQEAEI